MNNTNKTLMIHVNTPQPIGLTKSENWKQSYIYARWVVDFKEELDILFKEYRKDERKRGDYDHFNFSDFCSYLYENERSLIEPNLN